MEDRKHIVMLPFMAQGHLNPFMALANLIARRNPTYAITLLTTPLNILALQSSPHQNYNTNTIQLKSLPFRSSDHGLPPGSENTDSLPFPLILRLLQASETLQPELRSLLANLIRDVGRPRLCIIADTFLGWTVEIARELGLFHAAFSTCGAHGFAVYSALWIHLPHTHTDSSDFRVPGLPESFRINRSQLSRVMISANGSDPWSLFFRRQFSLLSGSDVLLCNTAEQLERVGLELLQRSTGIPVRAIGPLLPSDPSPSMKPDCTEWLDSHPPGSVLYVSFGSQNSIGPAQMRELAAGIEASGRAFIWVVRPPLGFYPNEELRAEWLPEGFEDGMRERRRGMIVRRWGPQLQILSHKSVGAFLSHCGWNSVAESLSRGVPIIGWPLSGEQFYNSKMMEEEELGVCVEIARGPGDKVGRGKIERVIEMVMGCGDKGKEMKEKAVGCADVIRAAMREEEVFKGSSLQALDGFFESIMHVLEPDSSCIEICRPRISHPSQKHVQTY